MDLPLPCPLEAGWELVRTIALPRTLADGRPLGGFSAAAYQPKQDRLWLLSDAPIGHLVPWGGLAQWLEGQRDTLRPGRRLLLRRGDGQPLPEGFDGEGLVIEGRQAWIASEGRRSQDRRARLIRIDLASGQLQQELPLPQAWRATPGQGLGSNKGPESLTALAPGDLLLAAEAPLLQHQTEDGISLMRRAPGDALRTAGALDVGAAGRHDGLTELLALPTRQQLLGLRRGFAPPDQWTARLQLFALPEHQGPPLQPIIGWDLLEAGLPPDNWEAMALGPVLSDGRQTLVLASDDNFNRLQSSWVAVLSPRRTTACTD
jgi:hypothetical protein